MYYAQIDTVSDSIGAIMMDDTIVGLIRGMLIWKRITKVEATDLKEVEIKTQDTDLLVLKGKFLEPNALEIYY